MTRRLPERDLEKTIASQVEELLTRFQWKWMHIIPAATGRGYFVSRTNPDGYGWPDYFCIRGERVIVIEVKSKVGQLSENQKGWLAAFRCAGIECYLWRPQDSIESITAVLR